MYLNNKQVVVSDILYQAYICMQNFNRVNEREIEFQAICFVSTTLAEDNPLLFEVAESSVA